MLDSSVVRQTLFVSSVYWHLKSMRIFCILLSSICIHSSLAFQSPKAYSIKPLFSPSIDSVKYGTSLKTAGGNGNNMYSIIPRLEPGLRVLRSSKFLSSFDPSEISNLSHNMMSKLMMKKDNGLLSADDMKELQEGEARKTSIETLFASAKNSMANFTVKFYSFVKKLVAISFLLVGGLSSVTAKTAPVIDTTSITSSVAHTATVASNNVANAMLSGPQRIADAAMSGLQALGFRKYKSLSAAQRLGTTPVYYVANARGNPFLQEDLQTGNADQKIVCYFMSSEDASEYLEEMAQSNPANAQEFHLVTTSLEKVVDNIISKKQSRKLGRLPIDVVYRLQASSHQVANAEKLLSKMNQQKHMTTVSVPMFSAPGLVVKRASGEMVTPYYFALEDLQEDWKKMVATQQDLNLPAQPPKVMVNDFTEVMCLAQGISRQYVEGKDLKTALESLVQVQRTTKGSETTSLSTVSGDATMSVQDIKAAIETPGFVAPRREIEMVKRYYRHQEGLSGEFSRAKLTARPE